jgi:hypothetical protein
MKVDLERIAALSNPHMKAINDAVSAAFPDSNPDQMYTLALAFQLGTLLNALNDADRPRAVDTINSLLAQTSAYRLVRKLDS